MHASCIQDTLLSVKTPVNAHREQQASAALHQNALSLRSTVPLTTPGGNMDQDLDTIDRRILTSLQKDCSLSSVQLAEQVGLSQGPCWRRVRRLETEGYIKQRVALLERRKLGLNVMIFAHVKLEAHGRKTLSEFEAAIKRFPEVLECHTLLGETDFLLKIVTRSVEAYEHFFREHLSQLPGVRETVSTIVLSEIKNTIELPLS
jgi:Lrp/AsnC family transcriptional regulator